jgi:hypothetical protein
MAGVHSRARRRAGQPEHAPNLPERGLTMTTEERIENLEKGLASARRLNRWLLAAVGLALGVWILAGTFGPATAAAPAGGAAVREVRANRFVVEDENGKARAVLAVHKESPVIDGMPSIPQGSTSLDLFDEKGKVRISMTVTERGTGLFGGLFGRSTGLHLLDENGKPRVELGALRDDPGMYLYDETGRTRASLLTTKDGPRLTLSDEKGKGRVELGALRDAPALLLFDGAGDRSRAMLSVGAAGAVLGLFDGAGKARASLGATPTKTPQGTTITYPESSLSLFDPDGKVIWHAP